MSRYSLFCCCCCWFLTWFLFSLFICSVLKKCGKKMPRYCDVNNDKRITLSEWLNCLQVQTNVQKTKASETSKSITLFTNGKVKRNRSERHDVEQLFFLYRPTTTNTKSSQIKRTQSTGVIPEKWLKENKKENE